MYCIPGISLRIKTWYLQYSVSSDEYKRYWKHCPRWTIRKNVCPLSLEVTRIKSSKTRHTQNVSFSEDSCRNPIPITPPTGGVVLHRSARTRTHSIFIVMWSSGKGRRDVDCWKGHPSYLCQLFVLLIMSPIMCSRPRGRTEWEMVGSPWRPGLSPPFS